MSGLMRHGPWRCLRQGVDIVCATSGSLSGSSFNNVPYMPRGLANIGLLRIPRSFNIL